MAADSTHPLRGTYAIEADPSHLEARAEEIAREQSAELPDAAVRGAALRDRALARVVRCQPTGPGAGLAEIAFPSAMLDGSATGLWNALAGNISLADDVLLVDVDVDDELARRFGGPRHGVRGLRTRAGATRRPLTCTALKPVGSDVGALVDLAYTFAAAGVDVVKDDHGFGDATDAPFEDRVRACAEAVARGSDVAARRAPNAPNAPTSPTIYAPHVTGDLDTVRRRFELAIDVGVGAVLLSPMLIGVGAFHSLAKGAPVPVLAHPALAGGRGVDPVVSCGKLFRLMGADASVFPNHGGRFSWTRATCDALASALRAPWHGVEPSMPAPAGGMEVERVPRIVDAYGVDTMLLIGGSLYLAEDLEARAAEFVEAAAAST